MESKNIKPSIAQPIVLYIAVQRKDINLEHEISAPEVSDGARQACATPHETQEQRSFGGGQLFHYVPEPMN